MNRQTRSGHDDSFADIWAAFVRHDLDTQAPPHLERQILAAVRARHPVVQVAAQQRRYAWLPAFSLGTAAGLLLASLIGLLRTTPPAAGADAAATDATLSMPAPLGALGTVQPVDPHDSGAAVADGPDAVNAATPFAAPLVTLAIDEVASAESLHLVRVRMPRAALGTLGLALYDPEATGMVDVDIVVGDDGLPRDIRDIRPVIADSIEE